MLKDGREKFLFGKVYTMVDSIEDKMDENYITEEEMNKIYCSKSEFEINKNNFLNDSYTKSSIHFYKCGELISKISNIIIEYLSDKKDDTNLLAVMFTEVLNNMMEGYQSLNI